MADRRGRSADTLWDIAVDSRACHSGPISVWAGVVRLHLALTAVLVSVACRDASVAPSPPEAKLIVLDGWPGPLRPTLTPLRDVTVDLQSSTQSGPPTARCTLPEARPVQWTRSRVVVRRPGLITTTASVTVDAIRLSGLDRVTGLSVQDSAQRPLDLEGGRTLPVVAQLGGRCLIQPSEGAAVWSLPCPSRALRVAAEADQNWWLEIACETGEGWFRVDEAAFEVEHYPGELRR
jgi:hypothetical protein